MAYISLYRKYRSQSFGELIGQSHVSTVLQNAIRMGRISHAYLFCGPRGCGKTSTARLLAASLNCQSSDGPSPEPCNECAMCKAIRSGTAMDVIEMDAASETGIDDVREKITENAKYAPAEARYKVYIIDEVHDLSLKAFDSLLKTIEEPPAHVIFILATTEVHKVPITVRSRCQRMDFKRGALDDLTRNLRRVLDAEAIPYEAEAVVAVARAAEGSFRDSLSLLEQVLASSSEGLSAETVYATIGMIGPAMLDDVATTLATDDQKLAFLKAGELVDSGKDVKQLLVALQNHFRDLMIATISTSHTALSDVSLERFEQLRAQAGAFSAPQLLRMLDVLAASERDIRFTNQHRLLFETTMWKLLPSHILAAAPTPTLPPVKAPPAPIAKQASQPVRATEPEVAPPAPVAPRTPSPPDGRYAGDLTLDDIRRLWPKIRARIHQKYTASISYITDEVQIEGLRGHQVTLSFPNDFLRERADKPAKREAIERVLCEHLGVEGLKIRCTLSSGTTEDGLQFVEEPGEPAPLLVVEMETQAPTVVANGFAETELPSRFDPRTQPVEPIPTQTPAQARPNDQAFLEMVLEEFNGQVVKD